MKTFKLKDLTKIEQEMLIKAKEALSFSYCPYSNFSVAASVLTEKGNIIVGVNVENISYGSTICAEANALAKTRSQTKEKIKKIAIIGKNKNDTFTDIIAPCGNCRQLIYEFSTLSKVDTQVIMSNNKMTKILKINISKLLPLAFEVKKL